MRSQTELGLALGYVPKTHPIGTSADLDARAGFVPDNTPIASVADLNGVSWGRII